jgi:hypothetical protein
MMIHALTEDLQAAQANSVFREIVEASPKDQNEKREAERQAGQEEEE